MALTASALTTLATVKSELDITASTYDTVLERYINAVSAAARTYMNRDPIHYSSSITEDVAGYGRPRIVLSRLPIVSITSITYNGSTIDSSEYEIDDSGAGLVYRENGFIWTALSQPGITQDPMPGTESKDFRVVYAGGWVTPQQATLESITRTLPEDIEEAVIVSVVSAYRRRGSDVNVSSESLGSASVTYGGLNTAIGRGLGGILTDMSMAMLSPWRRLR